MQGEYYTKAKRRDMDTLIRGHHFRLGTTNTSFQTTTRSDFTAHRTYSPAPVRSHQSSSIYLGTDQPEKTTCSRSAYSKPAYFPNASGVENKRENVKHHFTLGLRPADSPTSSSPPPCQPLPIHHQPVSNAIYLGSDPHSLSTSQEDYKNFTGEVAAQKSQKERCSKGNWKMGTEARNYETTSSTIGKEKGGKRELCGEARRTYIRMGEGKGAEKRSLSQELYAKYKAEPVRDTADRSAFVLSTHFSLGTESPNPDLRPSDTHSDLPPRDFPLPHLKKTSVELGNTRTLEKESTYSTQFHAISKGDRAEVAPWTGCSVAFGERVQPVASDYGSNFRRHSLVDNCLNHSLDVQKHNFELGAGELRYSLDYQTTAGEIGRTTGSSFASGCDFGSFSKKKHFPFGLRGHGGFETTTQMDYTYKGSFDKTTALHPAAYKPAVKGDYRTVHQTAYKWVQPVPSAEG